MDKIGEIFQKYVNLDLEDLIALATKAIPEFMPVLKEYDKEHDGAVCLAMMITSAFGADGEFTDNELAFLSAIHMDANLIKAILENNVYPVVDEMIDSMNTDQKGAALSFMTALCALDERISPEENAFLRQLLA